MWRVKYKKPVLCEQVFYILFRVDEVIVQDLVELHYLP
jgi:hypothetical protein